MGFFNKLVSKVTPQNNEKENNTEKVKVLAKYETKLNGATAGKRQELLSSMGEDEKLTVKPILTNGTLGLSVNLKSTSIGTIPSKISNELETKYGSKFEPIITKYKVSKGKEGLYECLVSLQINNEKPKS